MARTPLAIGNGMAAAVAHCKPGWHSGLQHLDPRLDQHEIHSVSRQYWTPSRLRDHCAPPVSWSCCRLLRPRPSRAKLNTVPSTPPWRPVPRFGVSTQACRFGGLARRGRCPGVQLVRPGWAQRLGSHVERCDVYVLWLHSSELLRQANTPHLPRRVTALRLDLYCTCTFVSASL